MPDDFLAKRDFTRSDLSGQDFAAQDLRGACFFEADLKGANFLGANLAGADLSGADLSGACLGSADLAEVNARNACFKDVRLSHANLEGAELAQADLGGARLLHARLGGANLRGANLTAADLSHSDLDGAVFDEAILDDARMRAIHRYKEARFIDAELANVDFTRSLMLRRFINDQNYLHELRVSSPSGAVAYWVWKITCDCGRSVSRWALWTSLVVVLFALVYWWIGVDYGSHETPLSPLYFSVVTITSLGFGDVLPKDMLGQVVVMAEIVVGYCLLGGLISLMSNKLARRAD